MELQPTAQRWESINLIFKLSALKDKLQVTQLPGWTHTHHPWCQASTAQLHWQQLRSEPWLSRGTMLGRKVIPTSTCRCCQSPWAVPAYCSSRNRAQKEREQFSACRQTQWGVRWAPGLKEWPPPTAGWLSHSSPLQRCQRGLCSSPQPEPTSRAKNFTSSTRKITSGYNTVSSGSLHPSEIDPEATTYGY